VKRYVAGATRQVLIVRTIRLGQRREYAPRDLRVLSVLGLAVSLYEEQKTVDGAINERGDM